MLARLSAYLVVGAVLFSLPTNLGCSGKKPKPSTTAAAPDSAAKKPSETTASDGSAPTKTQPKSDTISPAKQPQANKTAAADNAPQKETAKVEPPAPERRPSTAPDRPEIRVERFMLMAPDGPIIVEISLSIDGRSYQQAMEGFLDEVLEAADTNGDGRPTWEEVSTSRRFIYGQFGNAPVNNEAERAELIRLYDADRDGVVDRDETPRFITRNAGGGRAFSFQNSNYHRDRNRRDSPLLKLLNQDDQRALSAAEMERVVSELRRRDVDDDEILQRSDFVASTMMEGLAMNQMSNLRDAQLPATAAALNARTRWGTIHYWLAEHYAFGGEVTAECFPQNAALFEQLDENKNGKLEPREMAGLLKVAPQIRLAANFGLDKPSGKPATQMELVEIAPSVGGEECVLLRADNRVTITLPTIRLEFFVNDQTQADLSAQAMSVVERYDGNKDGYLTEEESPEENLGPVGRFEGVDANEDGKVYPDEIEAFLRQQQGPMRCQIRARAADQEDAVFTVLDSDGDGRLNAREIASAAKALQSFDKNGDESLSVAELPASMAVGFVRGNVQQDNNLYTSPAAATTSAETAPAWFTKMDANGDGDVSGVEFLGSPKLFQNLDQNGDGFMDAREAQQAHETANSQSGE